MTIRIATAPVSWGIWEQTIDRPDLIPAETFLHTIVELGYTATETGPPGYFAPDAASAVERAERHGVELIATFLPLRLDDGAGFAQDLGALDRTVEVLEAAGGGVVLLSDMETPERSRAAGSEERRRATGWDSETVDRAAERLQRAADIVRGRGLDVALHPHAATHVESEEETEQMLSRTDVGLCIDTGHTIVGGGDPVELARRHASRLRHVHLKDVDGGVLARLQRGEVNMDEAWPLGIFCEFGRGVVPIREFLAVPEVRSLDGFGVIEQDRVAVTVDDMPAVRAADERNRRYVEAALA
ncbi:MAG TPA: TIM barrel protein [Gaiellaceae bacterium]|nr:TIM barrel protein [Gaiellaceae bacterium]